MLARLAVLILLTLCLVTPAHAQNSLVVSVWGDAAG